LYHLLFVDNYNVKHVKRSISKSKREYIAENVEQTHILT
jgi:hypothetical protein